MKESEFHEWLKGFLSPGEGVVLGVGDDAAVLAAGQGRIAAAADMVVEGIHFDPKTALPAQIGAKAVNRSLSDFAAMGLEPRWVLVSAALPPGIPQKSLKEMVRGMKEAAARFGAVLVGGDTARSAGPLVLDVTLLGPVEELEPVPRSGARPGNRILVTGALGGSILGRHLLFTPRVREGLFLNRRYKPTAMIDLSDGLDKDLMALCSASGTGAVLEGERIPLSEAARRLAAKSGRGPLDHALGDGEDFELLFTLPPDAARALLHDPDLFFPVADIGEILSGDRRVLRTGDGEVPLRGIGFDHIF